MDNGDVRVLAALLHDEMCGNGTACRRGHEHQEYYLARARRLIERLEPEIGMANVLLVTRVFIDEMI